jgi:hypothetical protein
MKLLAVMRSLLEIEAGGKVRPFVREPGTREGPSLLSP